MKSFLKPCAFLLTIIFILASCGKVKVTSKKELGPAESVTHLTNSVAKGDASAAWKSLPKSYQKDINSMAHLIGEKMPPEIWNESSSLLNRIGKLLQSKKAILADMAMDSMPTKMRKKDMESSLSSLGKSLSLLAKSDIGKAENLKKIDLGKVADKTGNEILKLILSNKFLNQTINENSKAKAKTLADTLKKIQAKNVSQNGDSAKIKLTDPEGKVEEVEMTKVEGKWVPKKMAADFKDMPKMKKELSEGLAKLQKDKAGIMLFVNMAGSIVTTLENANTKQDFQAALKNIPIPTAMIFAAMGMMNNQGSTPTMNLTPGTSSTMSSNVSSPMADLKKIGTGITLYYLDAKDSSILSSLKDYKKIDKSVNLSNYVLLAKKGTIFSGSNKVAIACEKPDSSKSYIHIVFQDGHVVKFNGRYKTVADVEKALIAKGYRVK